MFLGAVAGVSSLGALAGCIDGGSGSGGDGPTETSDGRPVAQASFFVFGDFVAEVAGDAAVAETLVPIGQHGHGWEPGPQIRQSVADADLFVYGMEGFQPWADDMVRDVRADGQGVHPVAIGADVDLLPADHDAGSHDEHDGNDHGESDHGGSDHDEHGGDHEGTHHDEMNHDEHQGTDHERTDHEGTNHAETDHEESEHGEDAHDHGETDPHFWLDPRRAQTAVETVEQAFEETDPDDASRYAENAADYRDRLVDLDERFESRLAGATTDVVLVAGHDAFGYLGARYGIEFVTLTGLSPDEGPTTRDIERAQEVIAEHDLRYVCADPLESQRAARELVAETDAEEVLPLTSIPGRRESWVEDDWGYVDVMDSVNLPTLERALGAE